MCVFGGGGGWGGGGVVDRERLGGRKVKKIPGRAR